MFNEIRKTFVFLIITIFFVGCLDTDGEIRGTSTDSSNEITLVEVRPEDILPGVLNPSVIIGEVVQLPTPLNGSTCNASEILEWNGTNWVCVPTPSVAGGAATTVPASGVQPGTFQPGVRLPVSQLVGGLNPLTQIEPGTLNSGVTLQASQIRSSCINNQILQANGSGNFVCANLPTPPSAPVTSVFGRVGVVAAQAGDYSANLLTNVPAGNIAATNVQTALNELDSEKLSLTGGTLSGDLALGGNEVTGLPATPSGATAAASRAYVDAQISGVPSGADNLGNHTAITNLDLADNLLVGNGGSSGIAIDSTGRVGIGTTTNLVSSLEVNAGNNSRVASFNSDSPAVSVLSLGNTTSTQSTWSLLHVGSNGFSGLSEGDFAIHSNGPPARVHMNISNTTGNIGIGVVNPSELLHVAGNIRGTQLCIGGDCRSAWPGSGGSGTVTSVDTGTGLTGGPITGSGTISIANSGVDTLQLANDSVTSAKIFNGTIVNDDIASNTINATAKLTSSCTNNQILQADGSGNFVCANIPASGITSVFGRVTASIVAESGDYTATQITNVPTGNIAATNVQTALNELDLEKLSLTGGTLSGDLALGGNEVTGLPATPSGATSAASRAYIDAQIAGVSGPADNLGNHIATTNLDLADNLLVGNGGSSGIVIDSTGNVGVGTGNPVAKLEVLSSNRLGAFFTGTLAGEGLRVTQDDYVADNYVSLVEGSFDDVNTIPDVRIAARYNGSGSFLSFGTSDDNAAGITNEALTINPLGNVGIGTINNPSERLVVSPGNIGLGGDLKLRASNPRIIADNSDVNQATIEVRNLSTGNMVLRPSDGGGAQRNLIVPVGSVGIGTASPTEALEVAGTVKVDKLSAGYERILQNFTSVPANSPRSLNCGVGKAPVGGGCAAAGNPLTHNFPTTTGWSCRKATGSISSDLTVYVLCMSVE